MQAKRSCRIVRIANALVSTGVIACLAGCTVYPEHKSAGLMQTTSAEQVNSIFWQNVQQAKWNEATALLAPNTVWRVQGEIVPRAQIIPWLQSLGVHGTQVSNVTLKPAVNDMNLVYTLQIQADKAVAAQVDASCAGKPQTLSALAVWQQPQPTGQRNKDSQYRGFLLTVHDLTMAGDVGCH